ncbi:MAG: major capsid protein [Geminicoccaceae bacterium]|nr:major capsid protein [Geminicoccaceae bacterium]
MDDLDYIIASGAGLTPRGGVAQILAATGMNALALRPLASPLFTDREWEFMDQRIINAGRTPLRLVRALFEAGLTLPVAEALGVTAVPYRVAADFDQEASVNMLATTQPLRDRMGVDLRSVPLPITSHGFEFDLRELRMAARAGMPLDLSHGEQAARKVAEKLEDMTINGAPAITVGGATVYGLLTHPNRNTGSFGTNGNWVQAAKTYDDVQGDIETAITALEADNFYGPYWLILPTAYETRLNARRIDTGTADTWMDGLRRNTRISRIITVYGMPANNIVLMQATADVMDLIDGRLDGQGLEDSRQVTTENQGGQILMVPWPEQGGLGWHFRVLSVMVPRPKATATGKSGIFHMS